MFMIEITGNLNSFDGKYKSIEHGRNFFPFWQQLVARQIANTANKIMENFLNSFELNLNLIEIYFLLFI